MKGVLNTIDQKNSNKYVSVLHETLTTNNNNTNNNHNEKKKKKSADEEQT